MHTFIRAHHGHCDGFTVKLGIKHLHSHPALSMSTFTYKRLHHVFSRPSYTPTVQYMETEKNLGLWRVKFGLCTACCFITWDSAQKTNKHNADSDMATCYVSESPLAVCSCIFMYCVTVLSLGETWIRSPLALSFTRVFPFHTTLYFYSTSCQREILCI